MAENTLSKQKTEETANKTQFFNSQSDRSSQVPVKNPVSGSVLFVAACLSLVANVKAQDPGEYAANNIAGGIAIVAFILILCCGLYCAASSNTCGNSGNDIEQGKQERRKFLK